MTKFYVLHSKHPHLLFCANKGELREFLKLQREQQKALQKLHNMVGIVRELEGRKRVKRIQKRQGESSKFIIAWCNILKEVIFLYMHLCIHMYLCVGRHACVQVFATFYFLSLGWVGGMDGKCVLEYMQLIWVSRGRSTKYNILVVENAFMYGQIKSSMSELWRLQNRGWWWSVDRNLVNPRRS